MIVQAAENGKSYEVACDETTSIDMVQRALASLTSVGPADQVLICEGAKLESNRPLGSYGLPLDTKRVFLFNLAMLRGSMDSLDAAQQPEDDEGGEEDIPEPPSGVSTGHPLDEAQSPLLRALPFYERQFRYHHQKAEAVFHLTRRRFERCRALISEQEVQGHAIRAARENVDLHYGYICHLYGEFMRAFTAQHGRHAEILASFPRDMEALKSHRLHPSLLPRLSSLPDGRPRVTLADCVPDERLRAWAEDCRASHDRFGAKVASLQRLFSELQANVEEVFLQEPQVEIAEQEEALQESQRLLDEQASIVASLGQDERTVSKLVLDTMMSLANDESRLGLGPGGGYGISPTSSSGSSRPLDACAALDPMNEIHVREHLPVLEDCAEQLLALLARTREAKGGMSRAVFSQLRAVSGLQSRIRDLRNKLVAFKEICGRQQEVFAELLLVRRVPAAYRACLAEVRRRRAHAQVYAGQAAQLAERLADMRAAEVATRHSFARLHERYLPQEVLRGMGLYDLPAPCDVTIPPFDTNLIDLGPDRLGGGGAGVADDGLGVAAMLALLPPGTSQGLSGVSGSSGGIGGPFPSGSASSGSSSGASTGSGGVATGARQGASVASQGVEGGAVLSGREQGESVVSGQPAGEGVHGVTRRGEGEGAIGESGQPEERSGLVDGARPGSEDGLPPDASKGDGVHGGDAPSGTLSADRNRKLEKIVDAAAAAAAAVTAAVRAGECGECEREGGGQGVGAVEAGASDPAKHSDGDGGNAGGQGCVQRVASCQLAPRDSSVDASTMAGPGAGVDVCTMTSAATTVTTAAASTMTSATAITPVENTDVSTMTLAIASMPCDSTDASTMTLASAAVTTAAASTMTAAASSVMPSASMDVSTMTAAAATAAASTMTCAAAVSTAAAATMTAPAARSAVSTMTAATATTAVSTMTCAASVTNASTAMAPLTSADAGVGTDVSGSLGDVSAQAPDSALTAESGVGEDGETRTLSTATGTPHSGGGGSVDGSLCGGREDGFGEGEDVGEGGVEQTGQEAREGGGSATVPACGDREAAQEQSALREGGPSGLEREAADGQGDVAGPLPRGGDGMGSSHQGGDELLAHRGGGDDDMAVVQAELEMTREELHAACQLLEECQGNCTVLEARLREAREQVVTKSHAADRHATEYKSLRATTVRARGLLQRLQRCVQAGAAQVAAEQVSAGATVERVAAARPESGRGGRDPEESTRDGGEGGEGQEVETEGDGDSERARSVESDGGSASSMSSLHSAREGATRLAQSLRQLASSLAPPQERSGVGPLSHESSVEGQDLQHNRQGQQQRQEGPRLHEREGGNDGGLVQGDGEGGADWWAACVRALAEAVASIAERLAQVDVAREEAEASYLNLHAQVQQGLQQSMGEPPRGPGGSSTWQDPGGQDEALILGGQGGVAAGDRGRDLADFATERLHDEASQQDPRRLSAAVQNWIAGAGVGVAMTGGGVQPGQGGVRGGRGSAEWTPGLTRDEFFDGGHAAF
eukprot:jgi/Mesvir1/5472/Mv15526-RA.3